MLESLGMSSTCRSCVCELDGRAWLEIDVAGDEIVMMHGDRV
jgi:hypothetical protein